MYTQTSAISSAEIQNFTGVPHGNTIVRTPSSILDALTILMCVAIAVARPLFVIVISYSRRSSSSSYVRVAVWVVSQITGRSRLFCTTSSRMMSTRLPKANSAPSIAQISPMPHIVRGVE